MAINSTYSGLDTISLYLTVTYVNCILSSSETSLRSILRAYFKVTDLRRNWEYELLLLTFEEAAVLSVWGVVWAIALARSRLALIIAFFLEEVWWRSWS